MESLTHLIHTTKGTRDTTRDHRVAKTIPGCFIVSPDWLFKCQLAKKKVDERAYPPIAEPEKGLEMDFKSSTSSPLSDKKDDQKKPIETPLPTKRGPRMPFFVDDSEEDEENKLDNMVGTVELPFVQPSRNSEFAHDDPPIPPSSLTTDIFTAADLAIKPAVTDFLKYGIDKLSSALEKPKGQRVRLLGRAITGISEKSMEGSTSLEVSAQASLVKEGSSGTLASDRSGVNTDGRDTHILTQFPQPSQALTYDDPEVTRERTRMVARITGEELVETPVQKPGKVVAKDATETRKKTRSKHQY